MNQILSDYFAFLAFYLCINPGDLYFYMNKIILNNFVLHFCKRKVVFFSGQIRFFSVSQQCSTISLFMYRRPILCTIYGAVDFLNVLKKYIMYI
jgi:hypothetical protein